MHEQRSPREQAERVPLPRWVPPLLAVVAFALVPWTLWLTSVLPTRHVTHNYRGAWVGFDVGMAIAFAVTAIAAVRFSRWLPIAASVTGTLLVCDAWFDILGAHGKTERVRAVLLAVLAELPTAAVCVWIARRDAFVSE